VRRRRGVVPRRRRSDLRRMPEDLALVGAVRIDSERVSGTGEEVDRPLVAMDGVGHNGGALVRALEAARDDMLVGATFCRGDELSGGVRGGVRRRVEPPRT